MIVYLGDTAPRLGTAMGKKKRGGDERERKGQENVPARVASNVPFARENGTPLTLLSDGTTAKLSTSGSVQTMYPQTRLAISERACLGS